MIKNEIIGVLELGSLNLKCLIVQIDELGKIKVLGKSINSSSGIYGGIITNISEASNSIRECIGNAEKLAGISLKKINVILDPKDTVSTRISKYKNIAGTKIERDDLVFLIKEAKRQLTKNNYNYEIIHIFNYNHVIDKNNLTQNPVGIHANFFSTEMTFISLPINLIKNIRQTLNDCDIESDLFYSSIYCLGAFCLTKSNMNLGSTILDLGHEKTSVAIFEKSLVHLSTIPIGINHLAKDISRGCSISMNESREVVKKYGLDFENITFKNSELSEDEKYLSNEFFIDSKYRKISKNLIINIMQSRIDEILKLSKNEIDFSGKKMTSGKNIYLFGGGSNLKNIMDYCSNRFDSKIDIIQNNNTLKDFSGIESSFFSCMGFIKLKIKGFETEAISKKNDSRSDKFSIFSKLFGLNS